MDLGVFNAALDEAGYANFPNETEKASAKFWKNVNGSKRKWPSSFSAQEAKRLISQRIDDTYFAAAKLVDYIIVWTATNEGFDYWETIFDWLIKLGNKKIKIQDNEVINVFSRVEEHDEGRNL